MVLTSDNDSTIYSVKINECQCKNHFNQTNLWKVHSRITVFSIEIWETKYTYFIFSLFILHWWRVSKYRGRITLRWSPYFKQTGPQTFFNDRFFLLWCRKSSNTGSVMMKNLLLVYKMFSNSYWFFCPFVPLVKRAN